MATDQIECYRLELKFVLKVLVTKKYKPYEIYRRMCDFNGEMCFSEKNVCKLVEHEFATIILS